MSKDFKLALNDLQDKLNDLSSKASSLEGQCLQLHKLSDSSKQKLEDLNAKKELYKKAVELLTIVEKSTKGMLKKGFEEIVTYALQYIMSSSEYSFGLEFSRRGNLQEIDFNLKTPDCKELHDIMSGNGGGTVDILSLALRVSLIELTKPKIEGFICLDEPFKQLSAGHLEAARNFLRTINRRIKRQIIMVTHKSDLVTNADKAIEIK